MAIDEAIFRENQRLESPPTLRFYGWQPPAVSLGYFQDFDKEVNEEFCREKRIDIVRRPTGGKAVLHQNDLTYSLVARGDHPLFPRGILGTYLVISRCIINSLLRIGIDAQMETGHRYLECDDLKAFCFSVPSQYEILVKGRKICGSAQVRSNGSFLQHGSILLDFDPETIWASISMGNLARTAYLDHLRDSVISVNDLLESRITADDFSSIVKESFEDVLNIKLCEGELTAREECLKERLLEEKYRTDLWNRSAGTKNVSN